MCGRLDEKVIQQNWTQSKKNTKQAFMFKPYFLAINVLKMSLCNLTLWVQLALSTAPNSKREFFVPVKWC